MFAACVQTVYRKIVLTLETIPDVLILGAGPAALTLASSCLKRGLVVQGVAPDPAALWEPRYGAWVDELHPDFQPAVAHTWTRAAVYTPDAYGLERPYAWLSTPRLQEGLRTRCAGAEWIRGRATAVTHTDTGSTVRLHSGRLLRARVVVDLSLIHI